MTQRAGWLTLSVTVVLALGGTLLAGETAPAAAPAPAATTGAPPAAPAAEPAGEDAPPKEELAKLNAPKIEWFDRIKNLAKTSMANSSVKEYEEAEKQLLSITDPNALEPMALVLYNRNTRWRSSFLKVTRQYAQARQEVASPLAVSYLSDMAVLDPSPVLRGQARAALINADTPRYPDRLRYQLSASTDSAARTRAAGLLADLKVEAVISDMVGQLVTEEWRAVSQEIETRHVGMDIRVTYAGQPDLSRTTTITAGAIATASAQIVLPTVRMTSINTTVSAPAGYSVDTLWEKVEVRHPGILESLKRLTGKDFGYDQGAWARWLTEQRRDSRGDNRPAAGGSPYDVQWGK